MELRELVQPVLERGPFELLAPVLDDSLDIRDGRAKALGIVIDLMWELREIELLVELLYGCRRYRDLVLANFCHVGFARGSGRLGLVWSLATKTADNVSTLGQKKTLDVRKVGEDPTDPPDPIIGTFERETVSRLMYGSGAAVLRTDAERPNGCR